LPLLINRLFHPLKKEELTGPQIFSTKWDDLHGLLFVEINFRIQTITFRSISLFKRQNRHTLTHKFSPQQTTPFSEYQNRANGHFRGEREKLSVRNWHICGFSPFPTWDAA